MKYRVFRAREKSMIGAICDEKPQSRRPMTLYSPLDPTNRYEFSAGRVREYPDGSLKIVCVFYFWMIPIEEEVSGQT